MSNVTNYLTPEEINAYQTRANQYDVAAQRGLAKTAYARQIGGIDYGRGQTRLNRNWDQAYKGLASPFVRRNILRSGIFQQGLGDYGYNRQQAFDDYALQEQRRQEGLSQQEQDIEFVRAQGRQQIEAERAARQAALAAQLRSIQ
jgi:hypothetical protein